MISAIFQHIYSLLSFNHNGQGLKTSKYFTLILIFICFLLSYFNQTEESVDFTFFVFQGVLLGIIYLLNKPDTVNAVFMIVGLFLFIGIFSNLLSYVFLVWGFIALNVMQAKKRNS